MINTQPAATTRPKQQFVQRQKLLTDPNLAKELAAKIKEMLAAGQKDAVRGLLKQYYPPDIADVFEILDDSQDLAAFELLDPEEAAEVLDELDACTQETLARASPPERLAAIVKELPSDEATDVVEKLDAAARDRVLTLVPPGEAAGIRQLLAYPKESAGGIMSLGFVAVPDTATAGQAIDLFRSKPDAEEIFDLYVVDANGALEGILDLRKAMELDANAPVRDHMQIPAVSVPPQMDRERVARLFARYDLLAIPVVEAAPGARLIGVITSDDIIDVIEAEFTEDMLRMAGSDAEEMERRSPARTALLRLPWIMATMFIELGAGLVIHYYDATLARILLLASFMPIISAISGNTGLQSATIIVRGLSTGQVRVSQWQRALLRQVIMTLILGAVTGVTLGTIGAIWYGKWPFGLVVALGMFAAVNIAGIVGTIVPLVSKTLGFDPAITSGPFETAFQDVVGISIFLTLATVLIHYLL